MIFKNPIRCGRQAGMIVLFFLLSMLWTSIAKATSYATWFMLWNGSTESWWKESDYNGAKVYVKGKWQSINWADDAQIIEHIDNCKNAGIDTIIVDLTNGWGWLNVRSRRVLELCAERNMKFCVAENSGGNVTTLETHAQDIWNNFAGPAAANSSAHAIVNGKPVIVCYTTRSQFNTLNNSTGEWRSKFTLVWSSGEDAEVDKWGWQLVPTVGSKPSGNAMFVTSAVKWASGDPELWRKSLPWLDYNFQLAKNNNPDFVIVGSYDDIRERNSWLVADTTNCLPGMQMRNHAGAVSLTAHYQRMKEWIQGNPAIVPGGAIPDGAYLVSNRNSGKLLKSPSSDDLAKLIQGTAATDLTKYFWFHHLGGNQYKITHLSTGFSVEIPGGTSTTNTQAQQTWNGTNAWQRWTLESAAAGFYRIKNTHTNQVLGVSGASTSDGAAVVQSVNTGATSQQWSFQPHLTLDSTNAALAPDAPGGLTGTTRDWQSVTLSWNLTPGVDSYTVKRSTVPGGPYTVIATGVMSNTFQDTTMIFGNDYYYVVSAVNSIGESAHSAEFSWASSSGMEIQKADNADLMMAGSSWTGGVSPSAFDTAVWNNSTMASTSRGAALGADLSWSGIRVIAAGGNVSIPAGNPVIVGPNGIRVQNSNNLNLHTVIAGADQTWTLGTSRAITVAGSLSGSNVQLTINGASSSYMDLTGSCAGFSGTLNYAAGARLRLRAAFQGTQAVLNMTSGASVSAEGTIGTVRIGDLTTSNTSAALGNTDQNGDVIYEIGHLGNNSTWAGVIRNGKLNPTTQIPTMTTIRKVGTGTWTLTGANTHRGTTTVQEGTLCLNNTTGSATGTGDVIVKTGATLTGAGIISGPVTMEPGAILSPGPGTLTINNVVTLSGETRMALDRGTPTSSSRIAGFTSLGCAGALIVTNSGQALQAGDTFQLFGSSSITGSFDSISLPSLGQGLEWRTDALLTEGTLTVVSTATPLEIWSQSKFSPQQLADPAISGTEADPDKDGLVNLLEYAFGSEPMIHDSSVRPTGQLNAGFGTLAYTRNKSATDLAYVVEASSALMDWTPVAEQRWQVIDQGATEQVTARDSVSVGGAGGRFMRLKVSLQP
jgi:autotransporter-associated beta strand protein